MGGSRCNVAMNRKGKPMTKENKIKLLEEMFEADAGSINSETELDNLPWDSMAMLSLIALVNEHYGKRLTGLQLKSFKKVEDLLSAME